MSRRALLAVLVRAVGLYYAVGLVTYAAGLVANAIDGHPFLDSYLSSMLGTQLVATVVCLVFADRIAGWFYGDESPEADSLRHSSTFDLRRLAFDLAGLYALLRAVRALAAFVVSWFQRPPEEASRGVRIRVLNEEVSLDPVVECVLFAALGIVLLFAFPRRREVAPRSPPRRPPTP
jgi:hypothetical protein